MEDQRSEVAALWGTPTAALVETTKEWPQAEILSATVFNFEIKGKVKAIGPGDHVILDYSQLLFLVFVLSKVSSVHILRQKACKWEPPRAWTSKEK